MTSPSPDLIARLEALKAFVRAVKPGGCRILSDPDCVCRLCTIDAALALLRAAPAPPVPTKEQAIVAAARAWEQAMQRYDHMRPDNFEDAERIVEEMPEAWKALWRLKPR